jgi:parvulin-like peptidyl-prolyl isomerase
MQNVFGSLIIVLSTVALITAGCDHARTSPESNVDLSNGVDLFRQPVPPLRIAFTSGPIATVNGVDITAEAFLRELNTRMNILQQRFPPEQLEQMQPRIREQILDQMIARQLLLQEAKRLNMTITDDELASYRAELEAALPPGVNLSAVLTQRGISEEQFIRDFNDDILVRKLIEQTTISATEVADAEVELFYQENQAQFKQPELATARHLLVAVKNGQDREAAREKASQLRERLLAGEDFAELVRAESDDPGSKESGGLYTFPRGQMVPEFEHASFTQEIGAIGDLVETHFGFHIIKVEKREEAREIPLAEVRSNVVSYLRSRKATAAAQEYINSLRQKSDVVIHQPL